MNELKQSNLCCHNCGFGLHSKENEPQEEFIDLQKIAGEISQITAQMENTDKQLDYFAAQLGIKSPK